MAAASSALWLTCYLLAAPQAQQPARDLPRATVAGSASISGVVLLDAAEPKPIRRARVTLNSSDLQIGQTVVTEDDGTFAFTALPAGRYTVGASKDGYVAINLGASRPGRPGTPVVVGDGERRRVSMRMPRGAVITGTVQDIDGNPAQAFPVRAMRHAFVSGERQLVPAGNQAVTDDRGVYRIHGLQAGDYTVTASPRGTQYTSSDIQIMSGTTLRAALDDLRGAAGTQARPGAAEQPSQAPGVETSRTFGYAAIYYPGTTVITEAAIVSLRQAEERSGIDFQVQLVPMAKISGTIAVQEGAVSQSTTINLLSTGATASAFVEGLRFGRPTPDGKFSFSGLPPGRYSLMARGSSTAAPVPTGGTDRESTPPMWAIADVSVDGNDVSDIALTLQPGYTLTGRLAFDGTGGPPAGLARTRVTLQAVQGAGEMTMVASPAKVDDQGQFTIDGIMPGRYRLSATLPGNRPEEGGWWLKSSVVNGSDTLDMPLDVRESVSGAVVTFSDRPTEIAGSARDSAGEPTSACFVIVAAIDRAHWTSQSRRVVAVRPNSEGKFTVKNLPPGEYFTAAVIDVEQNEWFDPRFLEQLLPSATRVTLGEAERKSQDVVVR